MLDILNKTRNQVPWFLYLILFVLIVSLLIVGGLALSKNSGSKTTSSITSTATPKPLSNLEIAKLTIGWLNNEKNAINVYSTGCFCTNAKCLQCQNRVYTPRSGIFPLWGKFKYLEKTQSSEFKLSDDIDAVLNSELQFNSYNCKFMFDLWKGDVLNNADKKKVRDICRNSGYEAMSKDYYQDLNVEQLDQQNKQKITQIIRGETPSANTDFSVAELKDFYEKAATYVSEYTTRDQWEPLLNDEKSKEFTDVFKPEARKEFAIALDGYAVVDKNIYNNSLLGIASIDLYQMTQNKTYQDFAKYLYNETINLDFNNDSYDDIYFSLFCNEMFNVTSDDTYQQKMASINVIINKSFDSQKKMAFKSKNNFYGVPENGLMVGLLSL